MSNAAHVRPHCKRWIEIRELCCLCSADVSMGSCKQKRRHLHGRTTNAAKSTLSGLLGQLNITNIQDVISLSSDAFVCQKCKNDLEQLLEKQYIEKRNYLLS